MARRNRKSRNAQQSNNSGKDVKPTEEELQQERSFFIWTGIITLLVVVGIYFLLF